MWTSKSLSAELISSSTTEAHHEQSVQVTTLPLGVTTHVFARLIVALRLNIQWRSTVSWGEVVHGLNFTTRRFLSLASCCPIG